jgi:hypothetical protein
MSSAEEEGSPMRYTTAFFILCLLPLPAVAQAVTFEREGVEYTLELPTPRWRAVGHVDVHEHYEFVNGEDRADGTIRLRKSLVEAGTTAGELYLRDVAGLKLLPGFVACGPCEGEKFSGRLTGSVFSYEFTSGGRPMAGRIYYLQVDARTYYTLHFTCERRQLPDAGAQADSVARSFRLRR